MIRVFMFLLWLEVLMMVMLVGWNRVLRWWMFKWDFVDVVIGMFGYLGIMGFDWC